jgi:hypothetical protein
MPDQPMLTYLINVLRARPEDPKNKETLKQLLQIQAQKFPVPIPPGLKASKQQAAKQQAADFPTIAPPGLGIEMTTLLKPCACQC